MAKSPRIGDVEMEILQIVWSHGEATVQDVLNEILRKRRVAYTSVMTMMRNLSDKGLLKHRSEGRSYVYSAAVNPRTIKRRLLRDTVDKVFGGSSVELIQNLVETEKLSDEEVRELKRIIREL
jgi:predicted transcriptional regulator